LKMRQFRTLAQRGRLLATKELFFRSPYASFATFRSTSSTTFKFRSTAPIWLVALAVGVGTSDDLSQNKDFGEEMMHIKQRLRKVEAEAPGLITSPQFHDEFSMLLKLLDKEPIEERDVQQLNEIATKLEQAVKFTVVQEHNTEESERVPLTHFRPQTEYWKEFRRQHEKDWDKEELELKDKYNKKKGEWKDKYEQWKQEHPEEFQNQYEKGKQEIRDKYNQGKEVMSDKYDQTKETVEEKKSNS